MKFRFWKIILILKDLYLLLNNTKNITMTMYLNKEQQ